MLTERPARRMTLRQLLTHAEKCVRDLIEHLQTTLMPNASDFRDLSRPVRRRSHFPTLLALLNAFQKFDEVNQETQRMLDYLSQELEEIRDHAGREKLARRS